MLALIGQQDSLIPDLLEKIGVPPAKLKPDLERRNWPPPQVQGGGDAFLSKSVKKALDAAQSKRPSSRMITSARNIFCSG